LLLGLRLLVPDFTLRPAGTLDVGLLRRCGVDGAEHGSKELAGDLVPLINGNDRGAGDLGVLSGLWLTLTHLEETMVACVDGLKLRFLRFSASDICTP